MNGSLFKSTSTLVLAMMLSSCGGGAAPAPTTPDTPPPPPPPPVVLPSEFETAEYEIDWTLDAINASEAYAKGFTGEGAIVGFVDFNFLFSSDEITWNAASRDVNLFYKGVYEDYLGVTATDFNHGHEAASIAAAKKNDYGMQGVAFDAEVLAVDFFSGVYVQEFDQDGVHYYYSDPYSYLYDNGARVISKSIGYDEEDFIAVPPGGVGGGGEHYITAPPEIFIELGGLVVAAAGNDGDPEPMVSNMEALQGAINANWYDTSGFMIIAGAIDPDGEIAAFSDRAGSAGAPRPIELGGGVYSIDPSQYYLLAPGQNLAVSDPDEVDGVSGRNGTSYAAPHISGAAALLFGMWPQLTAREVGAILLNSATDMGVPGVDAIYGHGLLNVDAATEPLGTVSMVIGGMSVAVSVGSSISIGSSRISLGSAFGDASPTGLSEVMLLDSYNRDFYVDLSHQVMAADARLNLGSRLEMDIRSDGGMWQLGRGVQMGFTSRRSAVSDSVKLALSYDQQTTMKNQVQSWHLRGSSSDKRSWAVGSGAALSDVMTSFASGKGPTRQFYLTGHQAFGPSTSNSYYVASDMLISKDLHLSFGFKRGSLKGYDNHPLALYHDDLPAWEMESRLSKNFEKGSLSFALGALVEKQAILGSRSGGGIKLASDTRTLKADIFAKYNLTSSLSLSAQGHIGRSEVNAAKTSLFAGVNDFISSSWSVELSGSDIFASGDAFGFKLSQPLRVENAHATIETAYFDYSTKAPVSIVNEVSFSPTSREVAAEFGYKKTFAGWIVEANVAQRFNAGHSKGLSDTVGLLRIARNF